ncbi:hypothetical protein [Cedecea neteri]|uniref:hypothetical protein n=1 Tax=Cedecea neteri TaxID=158822 RepID=UPI000B1BC996|nr:hypothetical protein [Cedecea neteri]
MDIFGAYFQPRTSFSGFLVPDVVISESHSDTLKNRLSSRRVWPEHQRPCLGPAWRGND